MNQKFSVGLPLALMLILVTATALSSCLLSTTQQVIEEVLPMAQKNDALHYQDKFSNEELTVIVQLAKENHIVLPEAILNASKNGYGYSEQETIMDLARSEFGPYYEWSIEEKYWFEEIMVVIGWKTQNDHRLPSGTELSSEQALKVAQDYVEQNYGDPVMDCNRWKHTETYRVASNADTPQWHFTFEPLHVADRKFALTLTTDGSLVACEVQEAHSNNGSDIIFHYQEVYGPYQEWTTQLWFEFGQAIKSAIPDNHPAWAFQHTDYILPKDNFLSQSEAEQIALTTVGTSYTSVGSAVCCMDQEIAIWKIVTHTTEPKDIGSGRYSAVWILEIDAVTGHIYGKREFVVGQNTDYLTNWIPWFVYENLPEQPKR